MKHFKLWIILIMLLLVLTAVIVFGRGWLWFGTQWEPGGEFNWGMHADGHKFDEDMIKLQKSLGLRKDKEGPPAQ